MERASRVLVLFSSCDALRGSQNGLGGAFRVFLELNPAGPAPAGQGRGTLGPPIPVELLCTHPACG